MHKYLSQKFYPKTPIEQLAKMCNSMEDLGNLFKQCNFKEGSTEDTITNTSELLNKAISKIKHLKTVTISDIQKLLHIGYPQAAKLYALIKNKNPI